MLLRRELLLKRVSLALSLIAIETELLSHQNLHDLNVITEDFVAEILNLVYQLRLSNLNGRRGNAPAVDLGDPAKRVCFQVTTNTTKAKVQKTLDMFAAHGLSSRYDTLRILILRFQRPTFKDLNVPTGIIFDPAIHVSDLKGLLDDIKPLPIARLGPLLEYLEAEMPLLRQVGDLESDLQALEVIRNLFDRPAFQDDWRGERNIKDFEQTATSLIGLLSTGYLDEIRVAKARFDFASDWRAALSRVNDELMGLLALYTQYVRSKEILPAKNRCEFKDDSAYAVLNDKKDAVIAELNVLLNRAGLSPVHGVSRIMSR